MSKAAEILPCPLCSGKAQDRTGKRGHINQFISCSESRCLMFWEALYFATWNALPRSRETELAREVEARK